MRKQVVYKALAAAMASVLAMSALAGCEGTSGHGEDSSSADETVVNNSAEEGSAELDAERSAADPESAANDDEEYSLVWEDNFDGDTLNTDDWNVELHEPGWVNAELQRYTALDEGNIILEDGILKIKPHIEKTAATEGEGEAENITSGRITTQNKHDFTYGRFEARAKVPTGKGYLPAFWLMATDEGLYGQWPKCGEIDIMEVMGQDTSKSYHTIHYGYNSGDGHRQNQGVKEIAANGFSDDYHVYRLDWEPGSMTWYVDDEEVYTTGDWYTGTDDDNQITYPAPFDQNFYIILNLAVGGSWVGYPGDAEKAEMNDKEFDIDYVKVYQKSPEYYKKAEEDAKRPEGDGPSFREPDAEGNYVNNPAFTEEIGLDRSDKADPLNWKFHFESDAFGSKYELSDEGITLTQKTGGSVFYSVQLKQENIPMYRGWEYELTFDAYSTEEREITVDVEGPDRGWIRYFEDTPVTIDTEKKTYTLNFTMNEKSDPNGSLEFNLGHMGTLAPVTINNVKLVHKGGVEIDAGDAKTVRPDGNYVYNGSFDQGEKRLGYWEFDESKAPSISVTNDKNVRELVVNVTDDSQPVTVFQSNLSPISKGDYELSFNARTTDGSADGMTVSACGKEIVPELTGNDTKYTEKMTFDKDMSKEESFVKLIFNKKGTYFIDNVFFTESALIKNGSFNAGLAGFTPYVYDTVTANYVIDSMNGNDNSFAITIDDTVANDNENAWYIQLNQDGVTLTEGKTYRLTFKAKSSINRKIAYSLQEFEGEWTNYSKTEDETVEIGNDWKTITKEFKMEYPTDTKARFNITLGSVGGERIMDKHDVYIDDIVLEELD